MRLHLYHRLIAQPRIPGNGQRPGTVQCFHRPCHWPGCSQLTLFAVDRPEPALPQWTPGLLGDVLPDLPGILGRVVSAEESVGSRGRGRVMSYTLRHHTSTHFVLFHPVPFSRICPTHTYTYIPFSTSTPVDTFFSVSLHRNGCLLDCWIYSQQVCEIAMSIELPPRLGPHFGVNMSKCSKACAAAQRLIPQPPHTYTPSFTWQPTLPTAIICFLFSLCCTHFYARNDLLCRPHGTQCDTN